MTKIRRAPAGEAIYRSKIEHCELNSRSFRVPFSGIDRGRQLVESGAFFYFYFAGFAAAHFKCYRSVIGCYPGETNVMRLRKTTNSRVDTFFVIACYHLLPNVV